MSMYEPVPVEIDFNAEFPTYILAFCPDTCSWCATNQRFFYSEYPLEFPDEKSAIEYFKCNPEVFLELEKRMNVYRPSFLENAVWLENIREAVCIKDTFGEEGTNGT